MTDSEQRQRLRFDHVVYQPAPDGSCRVRADVEWAGTSYTGEARGTVTKVGQLRCSAEATLRAAQAATGDRIALTLVGVKSVWAFDGDVIIAAVEGRDSTRTYKLVGAQPAPDDDLVRAAAFTVLDAVNRILSGYLAAGDRSPTPDDAPAPGR